MKILKVLFTSSILSLAVATNLYAAVDCPECKDCTMVIDLNVEFKNASSAYMDDSEREKVVEYAEFLKNNDLYAVIEGHTSKLAAAPYNYWLSAKRADKVKAELIKLGVSPSQVGSIGFGESSPLYDNNTEMGSQKNRRVIGEVFNSEDELSEYITSEKNRIADIKDKEQ